MDVHQFLCWDSVLLLARMYPDYILKLSVPFYLSCHLHLFNSQLFSPLWLSVGFYAVWLWLNGSVLLIYAYISNNLLTVSFLEDIKKRRVFFFKPWLSKWFFALCINKSAFNGWCVQYHLYFQQQLLKGVPIMKLASTTLYQQAPRGRAFNNTAWQSGKIVIPDSQVDLA